MNKYEEIVKRNLKIPYCNFENVKEDIMIEIVIGFIQMYREYPLFKKAISSIEWIEDYKNHINMLEFSNKKNFKASNCLYNELTYDCNRNDTFFTFSSYSSYREYYQLPITCNNQDYFSFVMYNPVKDMFLPDYTYYPGSTCGRLGVYHEFGHLIDRFLHISNSNEFNKLLENCNIEQEISKHATTSVLEAFAVAFSYYCLYKLQNDTISNINHNVCDGNIKYNSLIEKVGLLTDNTYKLFETRIKELSLNENYNFKKYYDFQRKYKIKTFKLK